MSSRPALLRLVADASDQIVDDFLSAQGFKPAPPLVERTIRRYLTQREFRDVDIEIFRDAAWGPEGGRVRIQLRSLVHPVQQVLGGFPWFELGPHADELPGSWAVHGPADVTAFAAGLFAYLRDVAIPWLKNTESMDSVLAHLAEMGHAEDRERLVRAWSAGKMAP